jgi:transposase
MFERTFVGLDVHARGVSACAIDTETGEVLQTRLAADNSGVPAWVADLPGPVSVVYEAGPTGYGLARLFGAAGIACQVAAPSKLIRPPGDRVKNDARDALHLARLLKLGEITAIRIPTPEEEPARDLVRAREDVRTELMRSRHQLSNMLLRRGVVYSGGKAWTKEHHTWLHRQRFGDRSVQLVFGNYLEPSS